MNLSSLKINFGFLLLLGSTTFLGAQINVKGLTISKQFENSPRTSLDIRIPIDTSQKFFRLNMKDSEFTSINDDTGYDFIANDQGVAKRNAYTYFDVEKNELQLNLEIDGAPQKGAKTMILKGTLVMEYEDGEKIEPLVLKLPFKESIQTPITTQIGEITIMVAGSATMNDGTVYQSYYLVSETPFATVDVENGDTKEYMDMGLGLEENHFVFKTEPEEVTFNLGTKKTKTIKLPFELEFGIGL